jgi:hypothetical protein
MDWLKERANVSEAVAPVSARKNIVELIDPFHYLYS